MACTTAGPTEILGTKCPSITSTWIESAPAASMARISSPNLAKSAERIDGAMVSGRMTVSERASPNTLSGNGQRGPGAQDTRHAATVNRQNLPEGPPVAKAAGAPNSVKLRVL